MLAQPRIAIPVPTSTDPAYNQRSWSEYASAVSFGGGEPVQVALGLDRRALRAIAEHCDGFCLPGSPADVDPARYGAERDPTSAPADPVREEVDFFLLDFALRESKPVLGICYGLQSMNVWRGGSLVQNLSPLPVNHAAGRPVAVAHMAVVAENSALAGVAGASDGGQVQSSLRIPINSSHHQAVAAPGDGLRIVARCPDDGVIEALENDPSDPGLCGWFVGVQWHPERSIGLSGVANRLFEQLTFQALERQMPQLPTHCRDF